MEIKETRSKDFYSVKSNIAQGSIKDIDTASRTVTGFYNAYNFYDDACDVLVIGCAKKSIKERGPKSEGVAKIKHALNHDLTTLPGKILTLEEKTIEGITGIYFETKMADTTLGNDTLKNYLEGVYDNHSIGFRYIDMECIERANEKKWLKAVESLVNPKATEGKSYLFLVKEIQLFEGSTVAFGCNELTPYLGVKSGDPDSYMLALISRVNKFENVLKSGTQSDDAMEMIKIECMKMKQVMKDLCALIPAKEKKTIPKGLNFDALVSGFSLSK